MGKGGSEKGEMGPRGGGGGGVYGYDRGSFFIISGKGWFKLREGGEGGGGME